MPFPLLIAPALFLSRLFKKIIDVIFRSRPRPHPALRDPAIESIQTLLNEDSHIPDLVKEKIHKLLSEQSKPLLDISVNSAPSGASVKVDGDHLSITPCTIKLAPGKHKISISKIPPPLFGISVNSDPPGGSVRVNKDFVSSTPCTIQLPFGKHKILIEKKGRRSWKERMMVRGEGQRIDAELKKSWL